MRGERRAGRYPCRPRKSSSGRRLHPFGMIGATKRTPHSAGLQPRCPRGKTAVAGIKDCETGHIAAKVVDQTQAATLRSFVTDRTTNDAPAYTDDASAYGCINRPHEAVKRSVGEYVRNMTHTNGWKASGHR